MMRTLQLALFLLPAAAFCQQGPAFDITDVHVSPRTDWVKNPTHRMDGGLLAGDRYEIRRATLLDLIRAAYGVDADKILGGPSWIDYDRFDITAKTKPGTKPAALKLMLQTLLADRFHLVVKLDMQPIPGYVLTAAKGTPKWKAASEDAGPGSCQNSPVFQNDFRANNVQCRNMTMPEFAAWLKGPVSKPVMDSTAIEGAWDFDLQYPLVNMNAGPAGSPGIIGAMEKIGLKLEDGKVPQPVLSVESALEEPTKNPPGVSQALPPLPAPEFDVASVKLSGGQGATRPLRTEPGGRIVADGMPPGSLIAQAFNQVSYLQPVGTPKSWGNGVAHNVSIIAKALPGVATDQDHLNAMLRALLIDRYKMKFHFEERPMDTDSLVAVKPKLTKADPANRTGCTRLPQTRSDGVRYTHLICKNMTMAQFAEQVQAFDNEMFYPALNETEIEGAWDFTVDYDPLAAFAARGMRLVNAAAAPAEGQAPDPSGSVSFSDAIQKQLGLKLEVHKRPQQVLVIDHMEDDPSDN